MMGVIEDPMLALIARFVVEDIDDLRVPDEAFLRQQVEEIRRHVGAAEGEEKHRLAMQWIREHAEHYRSEWQKKELSRIALDSRCPDCPLVRRGTNKAYCSIHTRWVALLQDYLDERISSESYVEQTLDLLNRHKENLKISAIAAKVG